MKRNPTNRSPLNWFQVQQIFWAILLLVQNISELFSYQRCYISNMLSSVAPISLSHQLLLLLEFITCGHHCQPLFSGITLIYLKKPWLPALLQQLISWQLNRSVKSFQLCGTEIIWCTEQRSIEITRMNRSQGTCFFTG